MRRGILFIKIIEKPGSIQCIQACLVKYPIYSFLCDLRVLCGESYFFMPHTHDLDYKPLGHR